MSQETCKECVCVGDRQLSTQCLFSFSSQIRPQFYIGPQCSKPSLWLGMALLLSSLAADVAIGHSD